MFSLLQTDCPDDQKSKMVICKTFIDAPVHAVKFSDNVKNYIRAVFHYGKL